MKRLLSIILVISFCSIMIVPATAFNTIDKEFIEQSILEYHNGTWTCFEITDEYRLAMAWYPNGSLEYTYWELSNPYYIRDTCDIMIKSTGVTYMDALQVFYDTHIDITGATGVLHATPTYISNFPSDRTGTVTRAINPADSNIILGKLQNLGHPAAYTNVPCCAPINYGGHTVNITETLYHQYVEDRSVFVEAGETITTIMALTALTSGTLLSICLFALETTVWVLTSSTTIRQYDVTLMYTKYAAVDGTLELSAGHQLRWKAYIGNDDAMLEQYHVYTHQYYHLSNYDFAICAVNLM